MSWTRIDNDLLPVLAEIGCNALAVYVALKSFANQNGECWPKRSEVAKRAGVCTKTVERILPKLGDLVSVTQRNSANGRTSNLYRFTDTPSDSVTLGVGSPSDSVSDPKRLCVCAQATQSRNVTRTTELEPLNKEEGTPASAASQAKPQTAKCHLGTEPKTKNAEAQTAKTVLAVLDLPENLRTPDFEAAWLEWNQYRREIKKPLTPTSIKRQLKKFSAWGPAKSVAAIGESIENTWTGIFEPHQANNGNRRATPIPQGAGPSGKTRRFASEPQ